MQKGILNNNNLQYWLIKIKILSIQMIKMKQIRTVTVKYWEQLSSMNLKINKVIYVFMKNLVVIANNKILNKN